MLSLTDLPQRTVENNPLLLKAKRFEQIKMDFHRQMIERIDLSQFEACPSEQVRRDIRRLATRLVKESKVLLNASEREQMVPAIEAEVFGLGPLEQAMHDPSITDILVNGPDTVFIERHGQLMKVILSLLTMII